MGASIAHSARPKPNILFIACTSYVDKLIGDVLAENTIVVLWGAHGLHSGEHHFRGKHNTMHLATRKPLIVKFSGGKARMLHDPGKDPRENVTVAQQPEYHETVRDMAALLKLRQDFRASKTPPAFVR